MINIIKKPMFRWLYVLLIIIILMVIAFFIADKLWPLSLKKTKSTQTILASDNTLLWRFADENGIWRYEVNLNDVSSDYLEALLNYEDRYFYQHKGINPLALIRAAWLNIRHNKIVSGGSTLSMQVARLLYPHDRTIFGKISQVFRTLQLELHYTKKEILTLYINHAPYGGTIEGIGAASWIYFAKLPQDLTASEAVLLAVLPQAPSRLRPDRFPNRAQAARDKVLDRLLSQGVWSKDKIDQLRNEEVWVKPLKMPQLAPLFSRFLKTRYPDLAIIHSTLDASLQIQLEDLAVNLARQLPAKNSLAILVVDHTDMSVKGYVGSADFTRSPSYGHVDMIQALRSPGSTLKPFLYALAIDEGLIHSASLLQDVPRLNSNYRPTNFDDTFYGPVSATDALKKSLNLPAVQLIELYGAERFTSKLAYIGLPLKSLSQQPNISYILGGASLKMADLVAAYSSFARAGVAANLRYTQQQPLINNKPFIGEGSAWIIQQMLSKQNQLVYKTGTSYGYRDAWAIGINPRYTIGVWVGRPDGSPVSGQYGTVTAVPILHQVNNLLLNKERRLNRPLPNFPQPNSVTQQIICWPTGQALMEQDSNCHRQFLAWIYKKMIPPTLSTLAELNNPQYKSGWHTIWINQQGYQVASDCEGAVKKEIALWPISIENWLLDKEKRQTLMPPNDPFCPAANSAVYVPLSIIGLTDQQVIKRLPHQQSVNLQLNAQGGQGQKWWFLDGNLISNDENSENIRLKLSNTGKHHLLLMDESGQIVRLNFTLY